MNRSRLFLAASLTGLACLSLASFAKADTVTCESSNGR